MVQRCLNPCSNGILSDCFVVTVANAQEIVLILVLMEYFLTTTIRLSFRSSTKSLNPCSNGMLSDKTFTCLQQAKSVLILVLMEYSLTVKNEEEAAKLGLS